MNSLNTKDDEFYDNITTLNELYWKKRKLYADISRKLKEAEEVEWLIHQAELGLKDE